MYLNFGIFYSLPLQRRQFHPFQQVVITLLVNIQFHSFYSVVSQFQLIVSTLLFCSFMPYNRQFHPLQSVVSSPLVHSFTKSLVLSLIIDSSTPSSRKFHQPSLSTLPASLLSPMHQSRWTAPLHFPSKISPVCTWDCSVSCTNVLEC